MTDAATPRIYEDSRQADGRFGPGNPGKPTGARHRISQRVVTTILADFEKHQLKILEELRKYHLCQYVSLVSRLLPRQALVECVDAEDLGAAEVAQVVAEARAALDRIEAGASFAELDAALAAAPAAEHRCNTVEYGDGPPIRSAIETEPPPSTAQAHHRCNTVEYGASAPMRLAVDGEAARAGPEAEHRCNTVEYGEAEPMPALPAKGSTVEYGGIRPPQILSHPATALEDLPRAKRASAPSVPSPRPPC
jgi:hypothetical protein